MSRSSVDLPQPEGPSSTTNLPDSARKLTSSTAFTWPKRLVTFSRTISDTQLPRLVQPTQPRFYRADATKRAFPGMNGNPRHAAPAG